MSLRRVTGNQREALHGSVATRRTEQNAAARLPHHMLMARAGLSVARLARALSPHARCIWIACGPGNNGGDGLVAATHLHEWNKAQGSPGRVVVSLFCGENGDENRLPADARHALARARSTGVEFADNAPHQWDLAIDALLGIGVTRPPEGRLARWLALMQQATAPTLCVDLPSGLNADTGTWMLADATPDSICIGPPAGPRHTLSLLTLKPGLFTADGRDAAGEVWLDQLGVTPEPIDVATAWLAGQSDAYPAGPRRPHASHKGSYGDVVIIGGQDVSFDGAGMTGAALLAARSALHAGAGRVYVGLLGTTENSHEVRYDPLAPELMFRRIPSLMKGNLLGRSAVVCGCGGGNAVTSVLPDVLADTGRLVLDADAINAIAADPALRKLLVRRGDRGLVTVLTPHPLEAARLLDSTTAEVMSDRLSAAATLAQRYQAICVLKGSGSLIASPGRPLLINPSGNAALATAGTGDVMAGMIGSALALPGCTPDAAVERVASAVFRHGRLADRWENHPQSGQGAAPPCWLSASRLAARVQPGA